MEEKSIIESIRDYFKTCPYLEELSTIKVDFLDKDEGSYSIEKVPVKSVINYYIDGTKEKQFLFIFASREFYSTDENKQNIDNLNLYEKIENWLETNSENGIFPIMSKKHEPTEITALSGGYLFSVNDGKQNARYQIQCRLNYIEERNDNI